MWEPAGKSSKPVVLNLRTKKSKKMNRENEQEQICLYDMWLKNG